MLTFLYWLLLSLVPAGLALVIKGLRGRYVDRHPYCRHCGYDLSGNAPDRTICTECGADIHNRKNIRIGRRQRQGRFIAAGCVVILLAMLSSYLVNLLLKEQRGRPYYFLMAIHARNMAEIDRLLKIDPTLVKPDRDPKILGNFLGAAIMTGDTQLLQQLMDAGLPITITCPFYDQPVLHEAVSRRNQAMVEFLLAKGCDVNRRDAKGQTALHAAQGHPLAINPMVDVLIKAGANVNAADNQGNTPLHLAAEHLEKPLIEALIAHGADPNLPNKQGQTPLHLAFAHGTIELISVLFRSGGRLDIRDAEGKTALDRGEPRGIAVFFWWEQIDEAAKAGRWEQIEQWLTEYPQIARFKGPGGTLLQIAASGAYLRLVPLLLAHGADATIANDDGETPLHRAVYSGKPDILQQLIDSGADVNARNKKGRTPLFGTIGPQRQRMARLLIENDADVQVRDQTGLTVVDCAAIQLARPDEFIQYLLNCGAPRSIYTAIAMGQAEAVYQYLQEDPAWIQGKPSHPVAPLHVAASCGQIEIATHLLDLGADPNAKASQGPGAPLQWALFQNKPEMIELLCRRGADVNAPDGGFGATALHRAVRTRPAFVPLLLKLGADPNATDRNGATPLHEAAYGSRLDIITALLDAGAVPTAMDRARKTPADYADLAKQAKTAALLRERAAEATAK